MLLGQNRASWAHGARLLRAPQRTLLEWGRSRELWELREDFRQRLCGGLRGKLHGGKELRRGNLGKLCGGTCRGRGFSSFSNGVAEAAGGSGSSLVQFSRLCTEKRHYFVHAGNLIVLAAINQTDMLLLRGLMVTATSFGIVYNLLQPKPLITPACWGLFFIGCHVFYITLLLWERQPIVLSPDQEQAYEMAFMRFGFSPRQFCEVLDSARARWCVFSEGVKLHKRGDPFNDISFLLEGEVQMIGADCECVKTLRPGKGGWLGEFFNPNADDAEVAGYEGQVHEMTCKCVSEWCRTLTLSRKELHLCLSSNPRLKEASTRAQVDDLWGKVHMGVPESHRNAYQKMVEVAVSDGTVDRRERPLLDTWRERHRIPWEIHLACLQELGWSQEEFEAGRRRSLGGTDLCGEQSTLVNNGEAPSGTKLGGVWQGAEPTSEAVSQQGRATIRGVGDGTGSV